MKQKCPRCLLTNVASARFCARCGLSLTPGEAGQLQAGRIRHPKPLAPPDGFAPCLEAEHLFFRWGPPSGDTFLLGTEGIAVSLFNGAYPLQKVMVLVRGRDDSGFVRFSVSLSVEVLPAGQVVRADVPSYELPDEVARPVAALEVALISAEFRPSE